MVAVAAPQIDVREHIKWARSIARGVRRVYRFYRAGQEERDLEAVAYLTLLAKLSQFNYAKVPPGGDPSGAFRGWVHPSIRCACRREAARLLNGGTYNTRRESAPLIVSELPHVHGDDDQHHRVGNSDTCITDDGRRRTPGDVLETLIRQEELLGLPELKPDLLLATVLSLPPFSDPEERTFWIDALRRSGISQAVARRAVNFAYTSPTAAERRRRPSLIVRKGTYRLFAPHAKHVRADKSRH